MHEIPPRRTRRPPPRSGTSLPLVPILIGVVVLGFIVGAALSLGGRRGDPAVVAVVTASPVVTAEATSQSETPAPADSPVPASPKRVAPVRTTRAPATPAPVTPAPRAPAPAPATAAPAAAATPARTSRPAVATGVPVAKAHPAQTALPPSALAAPSVPTARPRRIAEATAPLVRKPSAATAATSAELSGTAPADAAAATDDADSEFAKLASAVVRQYVAAIGRGDEATAYAAFGPGAAGNVKLIESGVLDGTTRIRHVEARGVGNNATVNVDLKTAKGLYFGQYTVRRTDSGAALITEHALNKL